MLLLRNITSVWWLVCAISFFRLFTWRYFVAKRRINYKTPSEMTIMRQAKRRRKIHFKLRLFAWRFSYVFSCLFFVFSRGGISLFRHLSWCYFAFLLFRVAFVVFSRGVFRLFASRYFEKKVRTNQATCMVAVHFFKKSNSVKTTANQIA